jgi:hypothetical protein
MYQEGLLLLIPLSFRHIPPTPPMDPPLYSTQIVAGKKLCRVVCDGADSFIFFGSGTESGTHSYRSQKWANMFWFLPGPRVVWRRSIHKGVLCKLSTPQHSTQTTPFSSTRITSPQHPSLLAGCYGTIVVVWWWWWYVVYMRFIVGPPYTFYHLYIGHWTFLSPAAQHPIKSLSTL